MSTTCLEDGWPTKIKKNIKSLALLEQQHCVGSSGLSEMILCLKTKLCFFFGLCMLYSLSFIGAIEARLVAYNYGGFATIGAVG